MHRNTFACSCTVRCLCILLAAAFFPSILFAQSPTAPTLTAGKLDAQAEGPVIDGRVNDAVWQSVTPYSTFTQQDPIEGAPASEKTEIRVIVGKGNVYIGIVAFDSDPSKIIVSQARRDASLIHYTLGGPYFAEYRDCEYGGEWRAERDAMLHAGKRAA